MYIYFYDYTVIAELMDEKKIKTITDFQYKLRLKVQLIRSVPTITSWKNGVTEPDGPELAKLCTFFNVSSSRFIKKIKR